MKTAHLITKQVQNPLNIGIDKRIFSWISEEKNSKEFLSGVAGEFVKFVKINLIVRE